MNVSIIGASGYSGLELIRLLNQHPHLRISSVHSSSRAGHFIHEENPHLMHLNMQLLPIDPEEIAKNSSLVFLATPSGVSAGLAPQLADAGLKVIDLSGDLRLKDPKLYTEWYGKEAAPIELLSKAIYGLPEYFGPAASNAEIIANPGCYPTASILGLAPLLMEGKAKKDSIIIDAKSGVSGAGRSAVPSVIYSEVNENLKIYKVHRHQHIPEIEQQLEVLCGSPVSIEFSTHLVPMTRGIMATIYVELNEKMTTAQLLDLYRTAYEGKPFVRIMPEGIYPATKQVSGSNYCDIAISVNERTGRATIVSVIDNLLKGAAGQAIQNANLLCGIEETAGLLHLPQFP